MRPRPPTAPARRPLAAALAALLVATAAAAGCTEGLRIARPVSYADTARKNYLRGVAELRDENYPEAVKYFRFLRSKFPFSRYATLAELRIADAAFAQERFLEAIDGYKLFLRFHPTHPRVADGYAAFRICRAYVEQISTDWFLVPPSYEKDQSPTRDAARELRSFLTTYPRSSYAPRARKLLGDTLRRLAAHDLYVARFYLDRDKPKGAILRLRSVLARYKGAGVEPEALYILGRTYIELGQRERARATFTDLLHRFPGDFHAKKARLYLAFLDKQ